MRSCTVARTRCENRSSETSSSTRTPRLTPSLLLRRLRPGRNFARPRTTSPWRLPGDDDAAADNRSHASACGARGRVADHWSRAAHGRTLAALVAVPIPAAVLSRDGGVLRLPARACDGAGVLPDQRRQEPRVRRRGQLQLRPARRGFSPRAEEHHRLRDLLDLPATAA